MLDTGSQCPKCAVGTIVLVSKYRRAPDKEYSEADRAGPIHSAQTQYRCSMGCTWTVVEKRSPTSTPRSRRWRLRGPSGRGE